MADNLTGMQIRKVRSVYRRWLKDEKFFNEIMPRPNQEFSDVAEVLRNLGSAIAFAQTIVNKHEPRP